jgi:transposase
VSAIAMISFFGLLDVYATIGTNNNETFYEFTLLPHLLPFNGTNPHSVVIMDNCSWKELEDVVAIVHFLPPYSPDLNPIELAFSKVKSGIKSLEGVTTCDIGTLMLTAFAAITKEDCQGWISHCGY